MITMLSARTEWRSEGVRRYSDLPIWPIATATRCVWLVCAIASLVELGWRGGLPRKPPLNFRFPTANSAGKIRRITINDIITEFSILTAGQEIHLSTQNF